jgi:hypothetical protein
MPKASMHEYHTPASGKNNVWLSRHCFRVKPVAQPMSVQKTADGHFGFGVLPPDGCHVRAALRRSELIHILEIHSGDRDRPSGCTPGLYGRTA